MQFSLMLDTPESTESVSDVIKELRQGPCTRCRLSILHPSNRGVMYRGNPEARILVLDIAPGDTETTRGVPLVGASGSEFEKWMHYLAIDTLKEAFITQVVQCQPPRKKSKDGKYEQRDPDADEISACWYPRTVRMIRAMPNLECVITLGWAAASALLGGDVIAKTHEGRWYVTDLVPRVAVFCLPHPETLLVEPSPEKKGKLTNCLDCFRREYLSTRKVVPIAENTIIPVL
jgi:uracil-DNA glycosylase family 4